MLRLALQLSDGWATYGGVNNLQMQYNHQWVNHRVNFVNPADPMVHTQGIEATWGALKTSLRHGTKKKCYLSPILINV